MEQVVRFSDAMQNGLSLDAQLAHVLEAAREAVPVDRLHLWALAPEGDRLLYVTGSGLSERDQRALGKRPELRLDNGDAMARAIRQKVPLLVNGRAPRLAPLTAVGAQSFYALPVIARQRTLGLLVADNARGGAPLVPDRLRLLSTFAMHVATAVDNTWLLTELQKRDWTMTEALEQQGATAEILKTIATSPTNVQPVFDAIARSVTRLCGGIFGAVLDARVVHVPDVEADPEYDHEVTRAVGMRSTVAVPLLRQGYPSERSGWPRLNPPPSPTLRSRCFRPSPTRR